MFHTHYDFDLAIGLIVVVFFICCLAVSFEPLKFNSLVCKYKKISLVINALILATVIWCLHFMGMLNEYFYIAQSVNNEFKSIRVWPFMAEKNKNYLGRRLISKVLTLLSILSIKNELR